MFVNQEKSALTANANYLANKGSQTVVEAVLILITTVLTVVSVAMLVPLVNYVT